MAAHRSQIICKNGHFDDPLRESLTKSNKFGLKIKLTCFATQNGHGLRDDHCKNVVQIIAKIGLDKEKRPLSPIFAHIFAMISV